MTETDQLGRVMRHVYDRTGQMTSTTFALGTPDEATVSFEYDLAGRKIREVNAVGGVTLHQYDAADRLVSTTDPVGSVTQYGYDAAGRRVTMTDAKNRVTGYGYDARGRLLTEIYPDGRSLTKTLDRVGLIISQTDEDGKNTSYLYDGASQVTRVTNSLGQVTQFSYDTAGNKIAQTDARGNPTTYQWDALNRRIRRTLPLGQLETQTFDAAGNLTTRTDFNGKTTTYLYDTLNQQVRRTPDASFAAAVVISTYTSSGQRATMTDATGQTTYAYDNRDRVRSKATPQGSLFYTYDGNNMVKSVLSSNTGGINVSYAYDLANRLTTVTDNFAGGGAATYTYEPTNVPQRVVYPNGSRHMFAFDQRDRLTGVSVENGASILGSWAYTYGPIGNRLTSADNTGRSITYGYDNAYKLTAEVITGDPSGGGILSYTHDAVGNRLGLVSTLASLVSQARSFDTNDRVIGESYDASGNTLTLGTATYTYEFENRMASGTNGSTVSMQYDGDGNRVARTEGTSSTRYLVDDVNPTGYAQIAEELAGGSVTRVYAHGLDRLSQRVFSGTWSYSYYGYDGPMGSVRLLTDASGSVTDRYTYDGFGNLISQTGTTPNDYLYRGEWLDRTLGLYYLRARMYRPQTGRFLTADTFEGVEVRPSSLSLYSYAENDPIRFADPSGHRILKGAPTLVPPIVIGTRFAAYARVFKVASAGGAVLAFYFGDLVWEAICNLSKAGSAVENGHRLSEQMEGRQAPPSSYLDPCSLPLESDNKPCKCKPCIPDVGTRGYRVDLNPKKPHHDKPSGITLTGPHWQLYEMQQNPNNCQCFWKDLEKAGPFPPGPAGAVPITPAAGGGCCE